MQITQDTGTRGFAYYNLSLSGSWQDSAGITQRVNWKAFIGGTLPRVCVRLQKQIRVDEAPREQQVLESALLALKEQG